MAPPNENQEKGLLRTLFSFPNPVNEISARLVAGMVVALSLAIILSDQSWLLFVLAYGFLARVATGPTLSPMGLLATRVLIPIMGSPSRPVPGPPKRFAQSIGLVFSITALVVFYTSGSEVAAKSLVGVLAVFATLESVVGFCAGCFVFNHLMRWGLIPESVCRECLVSVQPPGRLRSPQPTARSAPISPTRIVAGQPAYNRSGLPR